MVQLATSTVVALILVALVLASVAAFFLLGIQLSPIEARRTFAEGCLSFCGQIEQEARETKLPTQALGGRIAEVAVETAGDLEGTDFDQACRRLFTDVEFTWQCWNREGCCEFELPPLP